MAVVPLPLKFAYVGGPTWSWKDFAVSSVLIASKYTL